MISTPYISDHFRPFRDVDVALLLSLKCYSLIYNLISELDIKSIILNLDKRVASKKAFRLRIYFRYLL